MNQNKLFQQTRLRLALWLAMQPIYRSYKQVQQFTADAAHELRTPLAATQATVESALMISQLDEIRSAGHSTNPTPSESATHNSGYRFTATDSPGSSICANATRHLLLG